MAKEFTTEEIAIGIFKNDEIPTKKKAAAVADPKPGKAEPAAPAEPEAEAGAIGYNYKWVRESKTAKILLLLRPSVKGELQRLAAAEGVSVNEFINSILEKDINERKGKA